MHVLPKAQHTLASLISHGRVTVHMLHMHLHLLVLHLLLLHKRGGVRLQQLLWYPFHPLPQQAMEHADPPLLHLLPTHTEAKPPPSNAKATPLRLALPSLPFAPRVVASLQWMYVFSLLV